ncbi:hypothetical protein ACFQ0D_09660 [Micromonospora zhanjiangensis]
MSTLPKTIAPRRPLPIGSARSQSVPADWLYQSAMSLAASTCGGATESACARAVQPAGSITAPAPAAPAARSLRRVTSDIVISPSSELGSHP